MIITVLSRDKISQNLFRAAIKNVGEFMVLGTNSNQDFSTLQERLKVMREQCGGKDVIIFHALKRSIFAVDEKWEPASGLDFPKILNDISDAVIYTPTLRQTSYGKKLAVLKGDTTRLQLDVDSF